MRLPGSCFQNLFGSRSSGSMQLISTSDTHGQTLFASAPILS